MPGRSLPLQNPVHITLEDEAIAAEDGEPIAAALVAAGKLSFARSPKFHRPRGPSCMRSACDGCLARVDDVPNVMTCVTPAREGTRVEVQNTLGSRETDLLRVTDWFFPDGLDHHHLFAGVPGLQNVMQLFARRVAGLGRLPGAVRPVEAAVRRSVDVLVVGGGPAGMMTAVELASRGRAVELVDDAMSLGGGIRALGGAGGGWGRLGASFDEAVQGGAVRARSRATAGAVYGDDVLVVSEAGAEVLRARALVLASGAHDGVLAFEGNDVPGVMSARAAGFLLSRGVIVGKRVVVVIAPGGGPFGEAYAASMTATGSSKDVTVVRGVPVRVAGSAAVRAVTVREGDRERKIEADALVVDAPRSPSYELAEQAGATIVHEPRGYVPVAPGGKVREGVYVVGEAAGAPFEPGAIARSVRETVLLLDGERRA